MQSENIENRAFELDSAERQKPCRKSKPRPPYRLDDLQTDDLQTKIHGSTSLQKTKPFQRLLSQLLVARLAAKQNVPSKMRVKIAGFEKSKKQVRMNALELCKKAHGEPLPPKESHRKVKTSFQKL